MKRRVARCVVGACVVGMVAGMPGAAMADDAAGQAGQAGQAGEQVAESSWEASENMNVDLYGPPSAFEEPIEEPDPLVEPDPIDVPVQVLYGPPAIFEGPSEEPIQALYGPPPVLMREANTMDVSVKAVKVKAMRVALGKKAVKNAIAVKGAVGDVAFAKVTKGSSKRLGVNKKTGAVVVKKGTPKGSYKVKVQVSAAGDDQYLPAVQTVVVKVRVK